MPRPIVLHNPGPLNLARSSQALEDLLKLRFQLLLIYGLHDQEVIRGRHYDKRRGTRESPLALWPPRGLSDHHPNPRSSGRPMPVISRFYGIVVFMHYHDHDPPHVHADAKEPKSSSRSHPPT